MNFIEHLFGVSPDGGNGFLEFCLFAVPFTLVLAIVYGRNAFSRQRLGRVR